LLKLLGLLVRLLLLAPLLAVALGLADEPLVILVLVLVLVVVVLMVLVARLTEVLAVLVVKLVVVEAVR